MCVSFVPPHARPLTSQPHIPQFIAALAEWSGTNPDLDKYIERAKAADAAFEAASVQPPQLPHPYMAAAVPAVTAATPLQVPAAGFSGNYTAAPPSARLPPPAVFPRPSPGVRQLLATQQQHVANGPGGYGTIPNRAPPSSTLGVLQPVHTNVMGAQVPAYRQQQPYATPSYQRVGLGTAPVVIPQSCLVGTLAPIAEDQQSTGLLPPAEMDLHDARRAVSGLIANLGTASPSSTQHQGGAMDASAMQHADSGHMQQQPTGGRHAAGPGRGRGRGRGRGGRGPGPSQDEGAAMQTPADNYARPVRNRKRPNMYTDEYELDMSDREDISDDD